MECFQWIIDSFYQSVFILCTKVLWGLNIRNFSSHAYLIECLPNFCHDVDYIKCPYALWMRIPHGILIQTLAIKGNCKKVNILSFRGISILQVVFTVSQWICKCRPTLSISNSSDSSATQQRKITLSLLILCTEARCSINHRGGRFFF